MQVEVWRCSEQCMTGECLRKLRKQAGYSSQRELADAMDWSESRVNRYESRAWFCIHPREMEKLLKILHAQ